MEKIYIDKVRLKKHLIIYARNSYIDIKLKNVLKSFSPGSFVSLASGTLFSCIITKINNTNKPCDILSLDRYDLVYLKRCFCNLDVLKKCLTNDNDNDKKVFEIIGCEGLRYYFYRAMKSHDRICKLFNIACFMSGSQNLQQLSASIFTSVVVSFTDRLFEVFESDTSRRWKLSTVAPLFNISVITVRKRLDAEQTSFSRVLLDFRMNKAAELLLDNELKIHQIADKVGIPNVSYFIKTFKKYYGVTPKVFVSYFIGQEN
ncbi:TPA: helix-turn-helix transcriptional regulator [Escherichia coli]|uniref:helix-turn-helix transcriptional regulator n=1 Tax=Escherichia coli TaxID=562 RepID=UPI000DA5780A|nr:helix-turn-helix transcriptional regulator [Escherichia coli]EIT7575498.1 helix-turn-helix transcriptional regulator [Escherichia coli]EJF8473313.1 helix-turn-helix transcriptional regulator [Escherichia coli]ELA5816959.1 helix-turn-helix transcriptional regulator [Escherichia coli]ELK0815807.1 helix-turn-helix transcriptional regulator [Escherichia coli]MCK2308048.1 helix-turn-helix transcriptional regulator [Escherichia coli]